MEFFGKLKHRVAAFTLIEMMVTVAIIAILATIAIGQYDQLKVMAHRAEAKNALGYVAKLQEAYRIEHGGYYNPDAATDQLNSALKYGGTITLGSTAVSNECNGNRLGFKLKGCTEGEVRYQYYFQDTTDYGWVAVANADGADHFGLTCTLTAANTAVTLTNPEKGYYTTNATGGSANPATAITTGDSHYITDRRGELVHSHDILQGCN